MDICQRKPLKKLTFSYALKSFTGYLEGTSKSLHTIKNYRGDLKIFQNFLEKGLGRKAVLLTRLTSKDLNLFQAYLKQKGHKTNTQRRRILTVRKLLRYLKQRNKFPLDIGFKIPTPHKIERIPHTSSTDVLLEKIKALPAQTEIEQRNRLLFWTLAETGCLVSEISKLKFENFSAEGIEFVGKAPGKAPGKTTRIHPLSQGLLAEILCLKKGAAPTWVFLGHNKSGSLGGPITSRGVELLVKAYKEKLQIKKLTPRNFRQSYILRALQQGLPRSEIQARLGLKSNYAFRVFEPLLEQRPHAKN